MSLRAKKRGGPVAKQRAVPILVDGVKHVQAPQEWIGRDFRGAQDVAASVNFRRAETEQLLHPPSGMAPDPSMDRRKDAVHRWCRAAQR